MLFVKRGLVGLVVLLGWVTPAAALDSIFKGSWVVVGPETHGLLGALLEFSNRTNDSVRVKMELMDGRLYASNGVAGSTHVVRGQSIECFYKVIIVTGHKEMVWQLAQAANPNCMPTFRVKLDP